METLNYFNGLLEDYDKDEIITFVAIIGGKQHEFQVDDIAIVGGKSRSTTVFLSNCKEIDAD